MVRIIFLILFAVIAWFTEATLPVKGIGFFVGLLIFVFIDQYIIKKIQFYRILTTGLISLILLGIFWILLKLLGVEVSALPDFSGHKAITNMSYLYILLFILYLGLNYGGSAIYFRKKKPEVESRDIFIVDTSAIIDGRIVDVCKAGFLTKSLVIPEFVIREMQLIADSSIHEKRKKGRRGLNILRKMKESDELSINILSKDYENLRGVDNKLLALGKEVKGKIITTDYNLVKVAEVEGCQVINVNQMATILKPQHSVSEKVKVNITKKGNSKRQGVGYLDDDTMVVIEDGERYIGQTKIGVVTAYIQSETGKMLFCKLV
jgi:uncharacterized protein YacL